MRVPALLVPFLLAGATSAERSSPAPVIIPPGGESVKGKYIVKMTSGADSAVVDAAVSTIKADADHTYHESIRGFSASLTPDELEMLRNHTHVEYIEQDTIFRPAASQLSAPWGLARISNYWPGSTTYTFDDSAGYGTCVFVIDSGIDTAQSEFQGRAKFLANFAGDGINGDTFGHGTETAGVIGSKTYGVAKKTKMFAIKIYNGSGLSSGSNVIKAMDYVVGEAKKQWCPRGIVVNMSLSGSKMQSVNLAASRLANAGFFLVSSAGNNRQDASGFSPASALSSCTVGAMTEDDTFQSFSNFGPMVDIFAPGNDIPSISLGGQSVLSSGTSIAAAHVSGVAAYLLGRGYRVAGLCNYMKQIGLKNVLTHLPVKTPNILLSNGVLSWSI